MVTLPPSAVLFRDGDQCANYVLVRQGSIRVQMISSNGRPIVLYRVGPSESCLLTTIGLITHRDYAAEGITEKEVQAWLLPAGRFKELMSTSTPFREYVFHALGERFHEMLALIDELAFEHIEDRIAELLVERCGSDGRLRWTHKKIAFELGTAREVVSRQLKDFERRSFVSLHRGFVQILDRAALSARGNACD